jgi:hypothetical protein
MLRAPQEIESGYRLTNCSARSVTLAADGAGVPADEGFSGRADRLQSLESGFWVTSTCCSKSNNAYAILDMRECENVVTRDSDQYRERARELFHPHLHSVHNLNKQFPSRHMSTGCLQSFTLILSTFRLLISPATKKHLTSSHQVTSMTKYVT